MLPPSLSTLIAHLKRLSGVGSRTAERFAFELLSWPKEEIEKFGTLLKTIQSELPPCPTCGCLAQGGVCSFCSSPTRDPTTLCILSSPKDAFAVEETRSYCGLYHVIEHLLSPLDDRHAHTLRVDRIQEKIQTLGVKEIIIALDSTLEGDATSLYLKKQLEPLAVSVSRLAFGLPVGSSFEYIDRGTLARALQGRRPA